MTIQSHVLSIVCGQNSQQGRELVGPQVVCGSQEPYPRWTRQLAGRSREEWAVVSPGPGTPPS